MAVSDVFEPMHFARVFEETDGDGVNRSVSPALVEETSGTVEVFEVSFVDGRSPQVQVGDFEVGPEVTGTVAAGNLVMFGPVFAVCQPCLGVIFREWLLVRGEELNRLGPESRY